MVTVVNWNKYYYCPMVLWYHVTRVILVPIYHSIFHRITIDYFYLGKSDTARNRTHNLFRSKRRPIPLGHSDGF